MIKKLFFEGSDSSGKTYYANGLYQNFLKSYRKNYISKPRLVLCSEIYENNRGLYHERCDVFRDFVDVNPWCNDNSAHEYGITIIDRSPIIDIVINGSKSKILKNGLLSSIVQTNDLVFFTTGVSYERYKSNVLKFWLLIMNFFAGFLFGALLMIFFVVNFDFFDSIEYQEIAGKLNLIRLRYCYINVARLLYKE